MKRKRSPELASVESRKKASQHSLNDVSISCLFVRILQQYELLASVASSLFPEDLLALALSSKAIYHAIFPRPCSLENLLGKLSCPGKGIQIRQKHHKKSSFFYAYDCNEYVQCGATSGRIESRPCLNCKVTTCDECRVHCVYQSHYEKPSDPDELPNFSGFVLLSPLEVPIMSPQHLTLDHQLPGPLWQNPANGQGGPYHDQGFIDVPFDDDTFGPPEFVEDILNLNLGQHSLALSVSSNVPDPSPVLQAFYQVTEQRKRFFCDLCLPPTLLKCSEGIQPKLCHCTLRGRFLDRWLCLRCYETEEAAISKTYSTHRDHHACGRSSDRVVCQWCWGLVLEPKDEPETAELGSDPSTTESSS
ncbi:uncharacterized protein K460DRAFT_367273 [Cucurbitaria berberidis CBS 394.84]|uniref:Uncharacterized protein n=1 Tax=Cucurbitaria berberidis CBS 394.84 TaxID=1168544 RepID=A0A9P4L8V8_9PLEO|nr:uncharacterized protein K460DRAFT_367273 [Cucurbitaria berberidis CBS 394.84]KAF1846516.1 hypothetical protein K460DRAFT_367273 [Cucurbitaria berberidis CBS 394.84]